MTTTYELIVLLHPDLEIDVEGPLAKIDALIAAVDGTIGKRDNWGKKRLAYRIKKQDFAIYVYYEIALEGEKVRDLENTILITEEVLRHILVVHEEAQVHAAKPGKAKSEDASTKEPLAAQA